MCIGIGTTTVEALSKDTFLIETLHYYGHFLLSHWFLMIRGVPLYNEYWYGVVCVLEQGHGSGPVWLPHHISRQSPEQSGQGNTLSHH